MTYKWHKAQKYVIIDGLGIIIQKETGLTAIKFATGEERFFRAYIMEAYDWLKGADI